MNDIKSQLGIPITSILPGGPADRAGAKVGDRIILVDGIFIGSVEDYIHAANQRGAIYQVEVMRGNQIISLTFDTTTPAVSPGADPEEVMQLFPQHTGQATQSDIN